MDPLTASTPIRSRPLPATKKTQTRFLTSHLCLRPSYLRWQAAFFSLSVFGDAAPVQSLLAALSTSPLTLAVLAGAAQNVLSKSCK